MSPEPELLEACDSKPRSSREFGAEVTKVFDLLAGACTHPGTLEKHGFFFNLIYGRGIFGKKTENGIRSKISGMFRVFQAVFRESHSRP